MESKRCPKVDCCLCVQLSNCFSHGTDIVPVPAGYGHTPRPQVSDTIKTPPPSPAIPFLALLYSFAPTPVLPPFLLGSISLDFLQSIPPSCDLMFTVDNFHKGTPSLPPPPSPDNNLCTPSPRPPCFPQILVFITVMKTCGKRERGKTLFNAA